MEDDPEDLSSLHYQILFPPREPSHKQREYELEQHLALMDEYDQLACAPAEKTMDMEDLGNVTIEHLTGCDDRDESQESYLLIEEQKCPEEDMLDIGIEASDLGSLLQQFEQTEAAVTKTDAKGNKDTSKFKSKSGKTRAQDPKNLSKKISPVKRKSTILLEPQAMPNKRLRAKDSALLTSDRDSVSLPGSRVSSPLTVQQQGLSVICSADQGFDYLVMDHDYCSVEVSNGQAVKQMNAASSSSLHDSGQPSVEERKARYKQKYKIKKKGKKPGGVSGKKKGEKSSLNQEALDDLNLINKLPDYIHPVTDVALPINKRHDGKISVEEDTDTIVAKPTEEGNEIHEEKPVFFDKIPNYFLGKHMYQEISKVEEEEARRKQEEEEIARLKEKEENKKAKKTCPDGRDSISDDGHHGHRSRSYRRRRYRSHRNSQTGISEMNVDLSQGEESHTGENVLVDEACGRNDEDPKRKKLDVKCKTSNDIEQYLEETLNPATENKEMSNGCSQQNHRENSERLPRYRSLSSLSSYSRSHSRSPYRSRSHSSSLSGSSYSRSRHRSHYRDSFSSESSSRSRSRSRSYSRRRSYRRRRRRYSTYSSASHSSTSESRSRSRSHSRSRNWRPRSRSRSHSRSRSRSHSRLYSRSRSRSRRRSRSGSYRSYRSHSRDSDRGRRRRHRRRDRSRHRHRGSRSRRHRRSASIERLEKERKKRWLKEQQEQWTDRRVVYIGRIPYGTTRNTIRRRFEKFGEIERITLHFRDVGDNYAFVTFVYKCDAYAAVEGANNDVDEPEYDICFGGRRQFCKTSYEDLDSMGQEEVALEYGYSQAPEDKFTETKTETDFDRLLQEAMKKMKSKR